VAPGSRRHRTASRAALPHVRQRLRVRPGPRSGRSVSIHARSGRTRRLWLWQGRRHLRVHLPGQCEQHCRARHLPLPGPRGAGQRYGVEPRAGVHPRGIRGLRLRGVIRGHALVRRPRTGPVRIPGPRSPRDSERHGRVRQHAGAAGAGADGAAAPPGRGDRVEWLQRCRAAHRAGQPARRSLQPGRPVRGRVFAVLRREAMAHAAQPSVQLPEAHAASGSAGGKPSPCPRPSGALPELRGERGLRLPGQRVSHARAMRGATPPVSGLPSAGAGGDPARSGGRAQGCGRDPDRGGVRRDPEKTSHATGRSAHSRLDRGVRGSRGERLVRGRRALHRSRPPGGRRGDAPQRPRGAPGAAPEAFLVRGRR
jgi:hypothetical protein